MKAKRLIAATAIGAVASLVGSGLALADTIYNTVDNSVDNGNETLQVVVGQTASTTIKLSAQEFQGGNLDGTTSCLVSSSNYLLLNLTTNAASAATVAATSPYDALKPKQLKFSSCSDTVGQSITVTGVSAGSAQIDVQIDPSSPASSGFATNTAKFIATVTSPVVVDSDGDGVADSVDNCPNNANQAQTNTDGDNLGDACDPNAAAPATGSLTATGASGDEGATLTATGSFTDADGASTLTITKSAGPGTLTPASDGTWSWSYTTTDNGGGSVTISASDGEHAPATQTFTYSAANVAPTGSFSASTPVDEGSSIALAITGGTDPSSADVTAGLTYAFDCGTGSDFGTAGATTTASCPTADNGTRTVKGKIADKDAGSSEYSQSVTINNVAPTATFNAPATVNEGSAIAISLTSPSDVSSVDIAEGFTYAFDCGSGYGTATTTSSASCATTDNGSRGVKGKVFDKDGGNTEYTASVTVINVAPTATFGAPSPVDEGSAISLSLTSVIDPSSADVAAGFTYAFDCGSGYAAATTSASASCGTTDNETRTVKGKVFDKDSAFTEYTASVIVNNVAPAVTATSGRSGSCAVTLSPSWTDPGADTFDLVVQWGDGSTYDPAGNETSPVTGLTHSYGTAGSYSATVTVTDDDGGAGSLASPLSLRAYNTPSAILQPINASGTRSGFKLGSTIPVKITVTGCDGAAVSTLTPAVNLEQNDTTADVTVNEPAIAETPTNGKLMRWSTDLYIYNLSTKISQFNGGSALSQGTYTVSVSDPSFERPVKAAFDLRK